MKTEYFENITNLNKLYEINFYRLKEYERIYSETNDPELLELLSKSILQSRKFLSELEVEIIDFIKKTGAGISVSKKFPPGRNGLDSILNLKEKKSILEYFEASENNIINAYSDFLMGVDLPNYLHNIIASQFNEIVLALDNSRQLQNY